MGGTFGEGLKLSIFGESHGPIIGIVINNIPVGIKIDFDFVNLQMQRRRPGTSDMATKRFEADEVEIVSGVFNGYTTGAPICGIIKNTNTKSHDYEKLKNVPRPSHSDYAAFVKYKGYSDFRGGGHFSGRLTAPFVFAGAVARQVLAAKNIVVGSHILKIKDIKDESFDMRGVENCLLKELSNQSFPVINQDAKTKMEKVILSAKEQNDSVGGVIECCVNNLPAGVGDPFFDSLESVISSLAFSVPGVKGVEFGAGFAISEMLGSQANDEFYIDCDDNIKTKTNNNGGINAGISNAMPIIFRVAIKPTPSIFKAQNTVNIQERKDEVLTIEGRHDPCIASRAAVVIESVAAIGILDRMLFENAKQFDD